MKWTRTLLAMLVSSLVVMSSVQASPLMYLQQLLGMGDDVTLQQGIGGKGDGWCGNKHDFTIEKGGKGNGWGGSKAYFEPQGTGEDGAERKVRKMYKGRH